MPSMANITVKKADGVTDITFTALQPSSGDGVPAVWRSETVGTAAGHKPVVSVNSRWNGPKTARRVDFSFMYPEIFTDTGTGLTSVNNRVPITLSALIPTGVPDTIIAEAVAQAANLIDSSLVVDCMKSGYAPT